MFRQANGREISMEGIAKRIAGFINADLQSEYEVTVGTDSQNFSKTKMVEVIAVHRAGTGGIYFYSIDYIPLIQNLKQKINEETSRSLMVANELIDELTFALMEKEQDIDELKLSFQIHCDIGKYGKTSMLIKEITSWVTSQGYVCLIKPDSYAASAIANKYSK